MRALRRRDDGAVPSDPGAAGLLPRLLPEDAGVDGSLGRNASLIQSPVSPTDFDRWGPPAPLGKPVRGEHRLTCAFLRPLNGCA